MMTNEQLADAVARIAELDEKRPAIDLNTAEIHEDGLTYECPLCQGEGYVDGHQYINVSDKAINVFFSGIGSEFVDARRFFDAAPLMAQVIRHLWAEREQRENDLRRALHPNGVKHPQQGEWAWLVEEASAMQKRLDALEAHHCEAPRNKRIMELEKECAALAAHQCHKPYGDDYGNMRCEYQKIIEQQRAVMEQAREALAIAPLEAPSVTIGVSAGSSSLPMVLRRPSSRYLRMREQALAQLDAALGGV